MAELPAEDNSVEPFIIGVTGASASGKTTVCNKIIRGIGSHRCVVVCLDWFYKGMPPGTDPLEYNFDHPNAFDFDLLQETLQNMRKRQDVQVPVYDFTTHRQSGSHVIQPADVIIVEGILSFYSNQVRSLMHMKVFVDEDSDVCLCRRIKRDVRSRGRSIDSVILQYEKFVKPAYDEFILPTKRHADIIVPRGGENLIAIDLIVKHMELKMRQHDLRKLFSNLYLMNDNSQIRGLHTSFRDRTVTREEFVFSADRLIRLVVEYALSLLPFQSKAVQTPTGHTYYGIEYAKNILGVSIIRGGEAMESALNMVCQGVVVSKLLIEHGPSKVDPHRRVVFESLPSNVESFHLLLMDPVLDSGSTVACAIEFLKEKGCREENIIYLGLIASPEALKSLCGRFPSVRFITSNIDARCGPDGFVVPGVGKFDSRYFGTT
ncbi:Uridine kinase-like protein 1, chloroplastic [Porphyridium purpureum]|uniref:Uridine kinase n=1 Tax=Porphyridium purpureum TaxID=35688 RepID=A0A5J4Z227_PORPP|nr:Uridine kinase-like protein 1, chloroplastic [Porphyridium purpureum]|eukprot:POR7011..scf208_2